MQVPAKEPQTSIRQPVKSLAKGRFGRYISVSGYWIPVTGCFFNEQQAPSNEQSVFADVAQW
jgi:hypothetical protein